MSTTEATPRPWKVNDYFSDDEDSWFFNHTIVGPDDTFVCHTSRTAVWDGTDEFSEANAELIVLAVNTHDDLLAALIRLREWVRNPGEDDSPENEAVIDQAEAAIALAEGGEA